MRSRTVRVLSAVAMALIVLYVLIDVTLQFLPPHYSLVSDAESDLAVGPFGWIMRFNFAARAVMSVCVFLVVYRTGGLSTAARAGAVLLPAAGLCSLALVFWNTDVNRIGEFGMSPHTPTGTIHVIFATAGFLAILAGIILLTPWVRRVVRSHSATVFLVIACAGLGSLGISIAVIPQIVGLTERLCLVGILGWAFCVCLGIRSRASIAAGNVSVSERERPR